MSWPLNVASASSLLPYTIDRHQPAPWEVKCKVGLSHSHSCKSTNWWIELHYPVGRPSTVFKYSSNLTWSWPSTASPNSLNEDLGMHLKVHLITASKCIYKYARLLPPSESPSLLDHGLGAYLWNHSIVILRHTLNYSQAPPAVSPDIRCVNGKLYQKNVFSHWKPQECLRGCGV